MELTEKDKAIIRELAESRKFQDRLIGPGQTRAGLKRKTGTTRAEKYNLKGSRVKKAPKKADFGAKTQKNATEKLRQKAIVHKNTKSLIQKRDKNPFSKLEEGL